MNDMRTLLTITLLTIIYTSLVAQSNPKYALKYRETGSHNVLTATVKNKKHVIIKESEESCMNIEKTADFNGDGFTDALIRIINGCGGNCCGDSYQIVFYDGKNFHKSDIVGYDWDDIEIKKVGSGYTFRIETIDEGVGNSSLCENKVETFSVQDYDFVITDIVKDTYINSIKEVKWVDFEMNNDPDSLTLMYDINGDGKNDEFIFRSWDRWGRMNWSIDFFNGKTYESGDSYKRLGVLSTKTNSLNDLVADCGDILKWNGKDYVLSNKKR